MMKKMTADLSPVSKVIEPQEVGVCAVRLCVPVLNELPIVVEHTSAVFVLFHRGMAPSKGGSKVVIHLVTACLSKQKHCS